MAAPNETIKISIRNVNFYYGKTPALKNISFDIPENNITAIIGPSGCGKSTLLRCLNRLYELYDYQKAKGDIIIDGNNILSEKQDLNLLRANVGMVLQKPTPFPMTIFDNVAFGIRLNSRLSKTDLADQVEDALRKAALWDEVKDILNRRGTSLSAGQQQRLCIARSIAVKPDILLLDEPASSLDPISTAKLERLITTLKKDYTIVIVTHNMQQAMRVSDYTAYIYLGELIEFDTTHTIFNNPSMDSTRQYVSGEYG